VPASEPSDRDLLAESVEILESLRPDSDLARRIRDRLTTTCPHCGCAYTSHLGADTRAGRYCVQCGQYGRALIRSGDGHLLVLTTGDLPVRPDLDTDDIAALVEVLDAWLRLGDILPTTREREQANGAVRAVREKLRACL
jgi:hypothetical protein